MQCMCGLGILRAKTENRLKLPKSPKTGVPRTGSKVLVGMCVPHKRKAPLEAMRPGATGAGA